MFITNKNKAAFVSATHEEGRVELSMTGGPKSLGQSGNIEAKAALSSFEAVLGTLTRTKESIGRATRIAIDCAKFGYATKVYCSRVFSLPVFSATREVYMNSVPCTEQAWQFYRTSKFAPFKL